MERDILDTIDLRQLGRELQRARKRKGWTQEAAAREIGVTRTTMVAIEKGERRLKAGELIKLAHAYGRPVGDFVRQRPDIEPFEVQFRGPFVRTDRDEREIEPVIQEFEDLCRNYLELEQITDSPLVRRYPAEYRVARGPVERAAESIALEERGRLGLGDGPVPGLRDLLEQDVGLRVFFVAMPQRFCEIYGYTDQVGGCLAVNRTHPEERRRWSMAHGYFHFLATRRTPAVGVSDGYQRQPQTERLADTFARFFLMPTAGLVRRFNDNLARGETVTPTVLCTSAHHYGVSVEAFTLHLESMRLLPSGTWERLKGRLKVRELQRRLGLEALPARDQKLPLRYQYLALEAFREGEISEGQLARFLEVDRLEARRMALELKRSDDEPAPACLLGLDAPGG